MFCCDAFQGKGENALLKKTDNSIQRCVSSFQIEKGQVLQVLSCYCFFDNGRLSAAICVIYFCTFLDGSKSKTDSISFKAYFYLVHVTVLTVLAHCYTSGLLFNYT